ncbi:MAG: 2-phospho-L-lactate guanylyltransferase [Solirubrobacterales bacterium]|nr:2-phospho-L-lactate guanylyltransferase [Solirubrobacterales bacterium]
MRATAIVPVKHFDRAKSRLSESAAAAHRPELAKAMLSDVLLGLRESRLVNRIVVVTGEPEAREVAERGGAELIDDPDDVGHSEAAMIGIADAMARGTECVALVPGDTPLLDGVELDRELDAQAPGVAVIPDHHGTGTNGLILSPPDVIEPSFGPDSRARHLELARAAGARCRIATVRSMALDLDTGDDLRELLASLDFDPARAPATAAALEELGIDAT